MRFPYMSYDTKIDFIGAISLSIICGLSIFGLVQVGINIDTWDAFHWIVTFILSMFGAGLGSVYGAANWFNFKDNYIYDKRREKYRTVKTY